MKLNMWMRLKCAFGLFPVSRISGTISHSSPYPSINFTINVIVEQFFVRFTHDWWLLLNLRIRRISRIFRKKRDIDSVHPRNSLSMLTILCILRLTIRPTTAASKFLARVAWSLGAATFPLAHPQYSQHPHPPCQDKYWDQQVRSAFLQRATPQPVRRLSQL